MISHSYFTGWACALVDSDAAAICLLPAGVVLFLIPKRLKVCINIILSWRLLFWLLSSWFGISLLWSIVVSWNIMMHWLVVDWLVMDWFVVRFGVVVYIVLSQMFWLVFNGDGSSQRIQHRTAVDNTMEFSKEFSHPMGLSLWAMYQGIICILLINILIAMMNTTYENVWKNVDGEWKFSKSHFEVAVQFHISALTMF